MFFFHPLWDTLILAAFGLSIWAQFKVKGNFSKYSRVQSTLGMTGAEVARRILDNNGLHNVPIEVVPGALSDHYDPVSRVVRLSEEVYYNASIASISVAAHEVGHAIQHAESYGFLALRHRMFPLTRFTSGIAPLILMAGFLFQSQSMIGVGIAFFAVVVLFQVVTLPVEFNASSRAKKLMYAENMVSDVDMRGVNAVLGAAALTYVAAALMAALELLKYIAIFTSNRDE
ncbi:MAG: zinc metallopeptidase [Bacilli bacterium]